MGLRLKSRKMTSPEVQSHNRWLSFVVCLLLALAVWIVFGQTRHFQFVNFDDDVYVYANPAITGGLSWHGIVRAFTHHSGPSEWLPLTAISRMADWQLYGANAGGHHLTNVLLHAAIAILLFLLLRNMAGALWPSAFVAAVFAIHPLRVESVAWVTERKDVLSGFFFMLTLWAYVSHVRRQGTEHQNAFAFLRSRFYWLALLCFVLGLLSKGTLVTLPFVLLLLDYWPLGRFAIDDLRFTNSRSLPSLVTRHSSLLWEKIPFLLLAAATCVATVLSQTEAILIAHGLTFPERIGNALVAYAAYLGQLVYPAGLAVLYPHPAHGWPVWPVGLSVLVLLGISAGVVAGCRKQPYLLVGWLWYLGMLVPVIGLVQVGEQAWADRYTYLPQIGLYIAVAWGMVELCGAWRWRRVMLGTAAAAIVAGLMAAAYVQTGYWKDSITLWTRTLACTSGNYSAHYDLGNALAEQGKLAEAIQHYERALQLNPDYIAAQNNLGLALARQGKLVEAIQHYQRALHAKPDYAAAHYNLGNALAAQGKPVEAIQHYERAIQLNPDYLEAHNNLGLALAAQGKLDEAIQQFERVLQLNPDDVTAHSNLGNALAARGKLDEAIQHCERALQLKPDNVAAHCTLANALVAQGRLDEAIQHFERALQLKPDDVAAHYNLGITLATQGKVDEAIPHFQQALALAIAQGNTPLAETIRARLKAYQTALPQSPTL